MGERNINTCLPTVLAVVAGASAVCTAVALHCGAEPLVAWAWAALPYVVLAGIAWMFRRTLFEQALTCGVGSPASIYGAVALLDGLVLHRGWLVSTKVDTAHLVSFFVPLLQLQAYGFVIAVILLVRVARAHMKRFPARPKL